MRRLSLQPDHFARFDDARGQSCRYGQTALLRRAIRGWLTGAHDATNAAAWLT